MMPAGSKIRIVDMDGNRLTKTLQKDFDEKDLEQQLKQFGARRDWYGDMRASVLANFIPEHRAAADLIFPAEERELIGGLTGAGAGAVAMRAAAKAPLALRAAARLAGPIGSALGVYGASEAGRDDAFEAAKWTFLLGAGFDMTFAGGKTVLRRVMGTGESAENAKNLGRVVGRFFKNDGTEADLMQIFRGEKGRQLISAKLDPLEAIVRKNVGGSTLVRIDSAAELNTLLSPRQQLKVQPHPSQFGLTILTFDDAMVGLKQLRSQRREILKGIEPAKNALVKDLIDTYEEELVASVQARYPQMALLMKKYQAIGWSHYTMLEFMQGIPGLVEPGHGVKKPQVNLQPLYEAVMEPAKGAGKKPPLARLQAPDKLTEQVAGLVKAAGGPLDPEMASVKEFLAAMQAGAGEQYLAGPKVFIRQRAMTEAVPLMSFKQAPTPPKPGPTTGIPSAVRMETPAISERLREDPEKRQRRLRDIPQGD